MAPEQIEILNVLDAVGARMERGLTFAGSSQICARSGEPPATGAPELKWELA
jgi:hypothetical protein